jgi:acyl carrier protein
MTSPGNCFNAYGPTEASICATVFNLPVDTAALSSNVPIGTPIPNANIYILDDKLNLVPVNVSGEICIGGAGLARGYLNQPGITAEKFIEHPFKKGERLYRSGDIGRWLPDGNIVFMGRKDDQVKVRGYRVELAEIESALLRHPGISDAAVTVKTGSDDQQKLIAYIVSEAQHTTADLRNWLKTALPAFMIPEYFVSLEMLPVTSNGKVDRKALPNPDLLGMASGAEYVAPRNETEEKLVAIWSTLLNRDDIGINDNFFDMGGNSIKIIQLSKQINQELGTGISIADLFQYTNIKDLVDHLNQEKAAEEVFDKDELLTELNKFNFDENE